MEICKHIKYIKSAVNPNDNIHSFNMGRKVETQNDCPIVKVLSGDYVQSVCQCHPLKHWLYPHLLLHQCYRCVL